jgi:transposase, IS5 family
MATAPSGAVALGRRSGRAAACRASCTHTWGGPEALARLKAHNARVRRVRCRIEKVFGTWKRSYGMRRMRWLGLAKAGLQIRLAARAYNLRCTITLLNSVAA